MFVDLKKVHEFKKYSSFLRNIYKFQKVSELKKNCEFQNCHEFEKYSQIL